MPITNSTSGTRIDEIPDSIHRISPPVPPNPALPAGFTFNQFLVVDDEPLLFHTGLRRSFPVVREAVAHVLGKVARPPYAAFSHFRADECGALNDFLAVAPKAVPVCGRIAAMTSVNNVADREPVVL